MELLIDLLVPGVGRFLRYQQNVSDALVRSIGPSGRPRLPEGRHHYISLEVNVYGHRARPDAADNR
jgi:hypothetical protein